MQFKKAQFVTGAPTLDHCGLARTSNTPGKTREMNYYLVDDKTYLVDLPGFGYAKVSKEERERWGRDIRDYLLERATVQLVVHLVDIRHKPSKLDEQF